MHELNTSQWDQFLAGYPRAHLLQSAPWGDLKAAFGWRVVHLTQENAGAQILFRPLPLGFTLAYIPKGPVGPDAPALWSAIESICQARRAIFIKVEPDRWESSGDTPPPGFIPSPHAIQPPRTVVLDLRPDEEAILAAMKQKTRYNIRLAARKGVEVRPSSDLMTFFEMIVQTGARDEFGVHSLDYYRKAYELFHPRGECELLLATYEGEPLGAVMVFARGDRAWYFYGASTDRHRNLMPNHLLQWEAIRWARAQGCSSYDLWGVPDVDENTLETRFQSRQDGLWGVYRFKRGFGGQVMRAPGPWDRVLRPVLYRLYLRWTGGKNHE